MPNVNFYLKEPQGWNPKQALPKNKRTDNESLILLQMKYKGQRLMYSTSEFVKPSQWNFEKQRVKNISATTKDEKNNLNDLLKNLEEECTSAYNTEIENGIPAPSTLKKYLDDFRNRNIEKVNADKNKITLISFVEKFKEERKGTGDYSPNTIKKYGTVLTHLKEYNKKHKIDFDSINLDFLHLFVTYLKNRGLKKNSIAKSISVLKTVLNEAFDRDVTDNAKFKHKKFNYGYEEVESVYLNDDEISRLYKFDFSKNEKLDKVRDTFIIGCLTGLRFGDYSSLRPENIRQNKKGRKFINVFRTEKTGEPVVVPLHEYVAAIYAKHDGFPKKMSNQKFNEYLKEVCKHAGLTEKGRIQAEPEKELWEFCSSHTARRSFCTNHYLSGFNVMDLMKISGHRTESAFRKYVKVTKQQSAERLDAHINMNKMEVA